MSDPKRRTTDKRVSQSPNTHQLGVQYVCSTPTVHMQYVCSVCTDGGRGQNGVVEPQRVQVAE